MSLIGRLSPDIEGASRRRTAVGITVLALAVIVVFTIYSVVVRVTTDTADQMAGIAQERLGVVPTLREVDQQVLRTYTAQAHLEAAQRMGVRGVYDREVAERLFEENELVRLENTVHYRIRLRWGAIPYVTDDTKSLLDLIGLRFIEALRRHGLPPYRFVITSATEPDAHQRALAGGNSDALVRSSQQFGTSINISYERFEYSPGADALPRRVMLSPVLMEQLLSQQYTRLARVETERLKGILGRVLLDVQREQYALVIYETREPVFHVTVNAPLSESGDERRTTGEGARDERGK
jgi:hypothetical protein